MSSSVKLQPHIAYMVGWWHLLKYSKGGIGIRGTHSKEFIDWYVKFFLAHDEYEIIKVGNGYIIRGTTKGRGMIKRIERERIRKFRFLNEFSGAYLAGLYEASRELANLKKIELQDNEILGDTQDFWLLNNLGMYPEIVRKQGRWIIIKINRYSVFQKLIQPYLSYFSK
ncbi:MAG: hypothetical protein QW785_00230 [Candidatus Anstonellales archaeon]